MKIEIPEFHRLHLRLGTCSWKYDSWKGLFYDPARKYRADDYRVGFVYLEGHYMPPIGDVFEKYTPAPADTCVIRLHGGDRLETYAQIEAKPDLEVPDLSTLVNLIEQS